MTDEAAEDHPATEPQLTTDYLKRKQKLQDIRRLAQINVALMNFFEEIGNNKESDISTNWRLLGFISLTSVFERVEVLNEDFQKKKLSANESHTKVDIEIMVARGVPVLLNIELVKYIRYMDNPEAAKFVVRTHISLDFQVPTVCILGLGSCYVTTLLHLEQQIQRHYVPQN
ncbi:hypothetical protein CBL_10569 [Carabus blaptoides fortunei]